MAFLNFEYKMTISYSKPVDKCYFTLKAIPAQDFRQRRISYDISMEPPTVFSESRDSFGNIQIIGSEDYPHAEFVFTIKGLVETNPINISGGTKENLVGMYKYEHGKCIPGLGIKAFAESIRGEVEKSSTVIEKCKCIMDKLYEKMIYEPGATAVETTAEEAFIKGRGVCQDYSHIYICLLRLFKIPARYVCGLIVGEGESHAWVEAVCDGSFVAFDPTYNKEISDEYIKLGVGRDAVDCTINRGVMWGGGEQNQIVNVKVEKIF